MKEINWDHHRVGWAGAFCFMFSFCANVMLWMDELIIVTRTKLIYWRSTLLEFSLRQTI